jgi:hypothetical protein
MNSEFMASKKKGLGRHYSAISALIVPVLACVPRACFLKLILTGTGTITTGNTMLIICRDLGIYVNF